jgi:hypothetical protein
MVKEFPIYFSDLSDEAKERFLKFMGVDDPAELNMDMDIVPLTTYEVEE